MSKLYTLIEDQVSLLLRTIYEDDYGQYHFGSFVSNMKILNAILFIMTMLIFIAIVMMFGLFLWNYGLATVFTFIRPIGNTEVKQVGEYTQLMITLVALMMFL